MKTRHIFYFLSFTLLFACDKIETPIDEDYAESLQSVVIEKDIPFTIEQLNSFNWDTIESPNNRNKQFILLQEFTGHDCTNCPPGTKKMMELDSSLGAQLTPLSIHAGIYAVVQNNPDGSFSTDHRVKVIVEENYLDKVGINGFPMGLINNNGNQIFYPSWEDSINRIKNNTPSAAINIINLYNDSLNIVRSIINYEWLETLSGEYRLQVFLSEDHVIDWQKDGNKIVEFYDHRHMLRKVVNPLFGVVTEEAEIGNKGKKEYIYSPNPSWKTEDLNVIAFLHKGSSPYTIEQVNSVEVIK